MIQYSEFQSLLKPLKNTSCSIPSKRANVRSTNPAKHSSRRNLTNTQTSKEAREYRSSMDEKYTIVIILLVIFVFLTGVGYVLVKKFPCWGVEPAADVFFGEVQISPAWSNGIKISEVVGGIRSMCICLRSGTWDLDDVWKMIYINTSELLLNMLQ